MLRARESGAETKQEDGEEEGIAGVGATRQEGGERVDLVDENAGRSAWLLRTTAVVLGQSSAERLSTEL